MSRKNFHGLLTRYLEGNCNLEEKETVEHWYKMLDDYSIDLSKDELLAVENKLWNKINNHLQEIPNQPEITSFNHHFFAGKRSIFSKAAMLIGFALITGLLFFYQKRKNPDFNVAAVNSEVVYAANRSGKPQSIYLKDGSLVVLQPGSALTYPKHFGRLKREVYLSGDGYFEISKNPLRPFLVYNNNTITRVVGTSFTIRTNDRTQQTEVLVKTGRVVVTENVAQNLVKTVLTKTTEVVLTPNQKTTFYADKNSFNTTLAAEPLPVLKHNEHLKQSDFIFNDTPVAAVIKVLEKTYAIKIIATKEVNEATFTGDINESNLYSKLDLICQSVHAAYKIEGTQIIIK
jgi:transmembrane sensor